MAPNLQLPKIKASLGVASKAEDVLLKPTSISDKRRICWLHRPESNIFCLVLRSSQGSGSGGTEHLVLQLQEQAGKTQTRLGSIKRSNDHKTKDREFDFNFFDDPDLNYVWETFRDDVIA